MNQNNDPIYFPINNGQYEVALSLRPLGFDFNNGDFDKKVFHFYSNQEDYLNNKLLCLKENKNKYVCEKDLSDDKKEALIKFIIERLLTEYPLRCSLEEHVFYINNETVDLKEKDLSIVLNKLCLQVQEDVALVSLNSHSDYISYLHLCSPSHWAAEDKIGLNFFDVHRPIPGIEKINNNADRIVEMMINKGPFSRFIWSFVTDTRLNHHPIAPSGFDQFAWKGRSFNKDAEVPFYLRIERQVIWGLPEVDSSVFTIGVSFIPGNKIKENNYYRTQLKSALLSMSEESRVYKGVDHCFVDLINYLE